MACEVHVKQERPCCRCSLLQRLMVKMTCQIDAKIPTDLFRASRTFISTLVKASRQSSKLQLQTIQKKKKVTVANGRSRSFCSQLTAHAATFFSSHQPSQRNQLYTLLAITKFDMNQGATAVTIRTHKNFTLLATTTPNLCFYIHAANTIYSLFFYRSVVRFMSTQALMQRSVKIIPSQGS